jgi:hypothetical protein
LRRWRRWWRWPLGCFLGAEGRRRGRWGGGEGPRRSGVKVKMTSRKNDNVISYDRGSRAPPQSGSERERERERERGREISRLGEGLGPLHKVARERGRLRAKSIARIYLSYPFLLSSPLPSPAAQAPRPAKGLASRGPQPCFRPETREREYRSSPPLILSPPPLVPPPSLHRRPADVYAAIFTVKSGSSTSTRAKDARSPGVCRGSERRLYSAGE